MGTLSHRRTRSGIDQAPRVGGIAGNRGPAPCRLPSVRRMKWYGPLPVLRCARGSLHVYRLMASCHAVSEGCGVLGKFPVLVREAGWDNRANRFPTPTRECRAILNRSSIAGPCGRPCKRVRRTDLFRMQRVWRLMTPAIQLSKKRHVVLHQAKIRITCAAVARPLSHRCRP